MRTDARLKSATYHTNPPLAERMEARGFTFHGQNDDGGIISVPHAAHWWCWPGPLGNWDIETGKDCASEAAAVLSAQERWTTYMTECEELREGGYTNLGVGLMCFLCLVAGVVLTMFAVEFLG